MQETPVTSPNAEYVHTGWVLIRSPLGRSLGLLADVCMSHIENKLLKQKDKASNSIVYLLYVNQIFAVFNLHNHVRFFTDRLEMNSVMKFTHERMNDGRFNFQDVSLKVDSCGNFEAVVYIKPTDAGLYTNLNSHITDNYKVSVIETP